MHKFGVIRVCRIKYPLYTPWIWFLTLSKMQLPCTWSYEDNKCNINTPYSKSYAAAWCGVGTHVHGQNQLVPANYERHTSAHSLNNADFLRGPILFATNTNIISQPTVTLQANEPEVLNCMLFGWSPPLRLASGVRQKKSTRRWPYFPLTLDSPAHYNFIESVHFGRAVFAVVIVARHRRFGCWRCLPIVALIYIL